jgi:hypothetical protein
MDRNTADGLRVFQGFSWGSVGTLGTLAAVVFTAGIAWATVTQRLDAVEGAVAQARTERHQDQQQTMAAFCEVMKRLDAKYVCLPSAPDGLGSAAPRRGGDSGQG